VCPERVRRQLAGYPPGRGVGTVILCPNLVRSPPLPTSWSNIMATTFSNVSGMGIMVHEWAHMVFNAADEKKGYFCNSAAALPANQQATNADNYRCVVESYALLAAKDLIDNLTGP
jgi:hypothetical protein